MWAVGNSFILRGLDRRVLLLIWASRHHVRWPSKNRFSPTWEPWRWAGLKRAQSRAVVAIVRVPGVQLSVSGNNRREADRFVYNIESTPPSQVLARRAVWSTR